MQPRRLAAEVAADLDVHGHVRALVRDRLEAAYRLAEGDAQSTERGDYRAFLTFVQPPLVEVAHRRLRPLHYEFDASDTLLQNAGASIVNAQWDFDYDGRVFRAARGEWFRRKGKGGGAVLDAQHAFPRAGRWRVACRVQDDKGGEGERVIEVDAE